MAGKLLLALWLSFFGGLGLVAIATAEAPSDPRYCGAPARNEAGEIVRKTSVRDAFRRLYACPSTGKFKGACPGWSVDHVIPLANGGCDAVVNMQWLPNEIKSGPGTLPKDRWERWVYHR